MKRLARVFLMIGSLAIGAAEGIAAEAMLEVRFSSPLTEPTALVLAYEGLFPVSGAELSTGMESATFPLMGLEPGRYQLYLLSASRMEVRMFDFELTETGLVQFEPAPGLLPSGNGAILTE